MKVDQSVLVTNDLKQGETANPDNVENLVKEAYRVIDLNDDEMIAHKSKQVDKTSSDTTKDKHVSNNDLKDLQDQITSNDGEILDLQGRTLNLEQNTYRKSQTYSSSQIEDRIASAYGNDRFIDAGSFTDTYNSNLTGIDGGGF